MVWLKDRLFAYDHALVDSERGVTKYLRSNTTGAQNDIGIQGFTSFNSNGFTLAAGGGALFDNGASGTNLASWTFRKQPKFFDVVTYTGNGSNQNIAHSLGSTPGFIVIKCTSTAGTNWSCWHRSLPNDYLLLNLTQAAVSAGATRSVTASTFQIFGAFSDEGTNGRTYVAYLFAHDAGGFGLTGSDSVISCGSLTTDGSGNASVTLGWEPQWVLQKTANSASRGWEILDSIRGLFISPTGSPFLTANTSTAESSLGTREFSPNATGFSIVGVPSTNYVYVAIRRGPMKAPTTGTSVFLPTTGSFSTGTSVTLGFPADIVTTKTRTSATGWQVVDRLRRIAVYTSSSDTKLFFNLGDLESTSVSTVASEIWNEGYKTGSLYSTLSTIQYAFRRAPSFLDIVGYTGTGSTTTVSHSLGVVPEMIIVKCRDVTNTGWAVYHKSLTPGDVLLLNYDFSFATNTTLFTTTAPTSSVFSVGTNSNSNGSGSKFISYLFATCPNVSKVGSYTGTGTTQQVNCGFSASARFVLIKRVDSAGDWYAWDSARGISASADPYIFLNSNAGETGGTDYIDPLSSGFEISSTAPAAINANGGTFVYLAIA
jgi:hypothetical protein